MNLGGLSPTGDQCEEMPKLNRRSVGTQSDVQVTEEEILSAGKQFDVGGRHSSLCKKSAYRNLLQKSITVVAADADEVESGSCRATQTHSSGLWITEDRRTGPARVGSSGLSVSIPGTSRPVVMQKDSASVQVSSGHLASTAIVNVPKPIAIRTRRTDGEAFVGLSVVMRKFVADR